MHYSHELCLHIGQYDSWKFTLNDGFKLQENDAILDDILGTSIQSANMINKSILMINLTYSEVILSISLTLYKM